MSDFFDYVLASGGSRQNRAELETDIFTSNGHRLRNYRIYGADGGVGDLDSDTDKYIIPVTISGKNILENTRIGRSMAINYLHNDDGSVTFSGTASPRVDFYIAGVYGSTDNILSEESTYICTCTTDKTAPNGVQFLVGYNTTTYAATAVNSEYSLTTDQISYFIIRIPSGTTLDNVTFYPMICSAGFSDHDFEQYYTQTTNVILDEPLNENDYIDFREQKRYNADETAETIGLPALVTVDGTNIISIDTTVQPDKIYVQGNIEQIEMVSVQSLQTNIQNLQLFSPDENESQLDVIPIEIPVQLNEVSETIVGVEDGE